MRYKVGAEQMEHIPSLAHRPDGVFGSARTAPIGPTHAVDTATGIADAVLDVIASQGELASFRILQQQPAQRDRPVTAHLRRFFGGRSGNKVRYARLLVDALPAGDAPPPLARLIASF